jgi:hypothetical protein
MRFSGTTVLRLQNGRIVEEIGHTWIVDLVSNAADVQLRKR